MAPLTPACCCTIVPNALLRGESGTAALTWWRAQGARRSAGRRFAGRARVAGTVSVMWAESRVVVVD